MIQKIIELIIGPKNERELKKLQPTVDKINSLEKEVRNLADWQLRAKTNEFKQRLRKGETLDDILPEAFAVVRETARRVIGERPFDVQLMGAIVLHQGKIAEMKTGEGKTLTATMPAYLNALTEKPVHIATVNDYLARRDREWMGPIYEFLGLSVGVIQHDMPLEHKKVAYMCDITYGTNNEFGFDYLRDNMVTSKEMKMQRGHYYCILDEVDNILIDEARTPLIISGPAEESPRTYYEVNRIVKYLEKDKDFELDEKTKNAYLTEEGMKKVEKLLKLDTLFSPKTINYLHYVIQAIRAHYLFKRDVDYVVKGGKVIIVDEFTGRLMPGRRWSEGLHQAIEAKENVMIESENQTLATITFQNYFKLYEKLAGMTGTAATEEREFREIYGLEVIVIPTNKPMIRIDYNDRVYKTFKGKLKAIVNEIEECYKKGQPVLVGTISIEKSEILSNELKKKGIPHQVLNAKHHEKEAMIIRNAGKKKTVTIATNMAGRGTDIVLGGYPDFKDELRDNIPVGPESPEPVKKFHQLIIQGELEEAEKFLHLLPDNLKERGRVVLCKLALKQFKFDYVENNVKKLKPNHEKEITKLMNRVKEWKQEHDEVIKLGGLHVIGTERHEARRIDNQLRGRSGRQGDPGSSRFYVSLEDDLMRLFGGERIQRMMDKWGIPEDQEIEHKWITRSIEQAQKKVEARNFEMRKYLLEYDNVMNKQREFIYNKRNQILDEKDIKEDILNYIKDVIETKMEQYFPNPKVPEEWDIDGFNKWLYGKFGTKIGKDEIDIENISWEEFLNKVYEHLKKIYEAKEQEYGKELMRELERYVMLEVLDTRWREHLYELDHLKESIHWRAYAEKHPLVEYKFEAFRLFEEMTQRIKEDTLEILFRIQVKPLTKEKEEGEVIIIGEAKEEDIFKNFSFSHTEYGQFDALREMAMRAQMERAGVQPPPASPSQKKKKKKKIGRNDPCWCGSGKKYKYCHGRFEK